MSKTFSITLSLFPCVPSPLTLVFHIIPVNNFLPFLSKQSSSLSYLGPVIHLSKFCNSCPNRCFRNFCLLRCNTCTLSSFMSLYSVIFFIIFVKIVVFVIDVIFVGAFVPSNMHYLVALSDFFLYIFVKMVLLVVFIIFVGVFQPSRALCYCTQQFLLSKLFFSSLSSFSLGFLDPLMPLHSRIVL